MEGFYGSLKSSDAHLRFVFLTGVSKFANIPYDIQIRVEK